MKNLIALGLCFALFLPLFGCEKANEPLSVSSENYNYLLEVVESNEHTHDPAETPKTVSDPITGYCGNIITKVVKDGIEKSFMGGDSVALTDLVINLDYTEPMCKCAAEFTVYVETEKDPYEVNLSQNFVRFQGKHASLTAEQVETLRVILDRYFLEDETREIIVEKPQEIPVSYPKAAS